MQGADIVNTIDSFLLMALKKNASDIHFEPYKNSYRVRMRIDGVLQTIASPPLELAKQITARLKIMSKLNIAEQRLPQDGQLSIHHNTMRISSIPVSYGEKIVLRVMDSHDHLRTISQLGMPDNALNIFEQSLFLPQGLILVTGPTGSGKTVTLYSGLNLLNSTERNICSVEDPIEIPIDGINQTQVNPKMGLTFSHVLRALLRQDPDVIMIGEIRDRETAEIAVQAAQTGHLVLSTLHTNSSIETLTRLNQIGIESYLLASSLKLIIAQRLVRKLCPHCRQAAKYKIKLAGLLIQHFESIGCQHCTVGYAGRIGLYELLPITAQIQAKLVENKPIIHQGKMTLFHHATELVKQGITTYAELVRVMGESGYQDYSQ